MHLRIATFGISGLLTILVGGCAPENVSCSSKETIEAVKRTAFDLIKLKDGFGEIDPSRSTTDVLNIKELHSYPAQASCTATLSQHLRFASRADTPHAEDRSFTLPITYEARRVANGTEVSIYGAIVPPDICAFLSRYTKDLRQGWRSERVPQQISAFTLKHVPSGMSCGGSDLYKDFPMITCGSLPGDPYFNLPSTWETLNKDATACLSADKFDKVRDEPHRKEWSKTYDGSHKLSVSWYQENKTYTLNLRYSDTK